MNQDQIKSKSRANHENFDIRVVDITDLNGKVVSPEWLAKSESVHRQLRPALPKDYVEKMVRSNWTEVSEFEFAS